MLFAERHNKLGRDSSRAHDRAEDLLTSTAFQLLRYIPPTVGLLAVLKRVRRVRWENGRAVVSREMPPWLTCDTADGFDLDFWPRWPGAGEPDVVVSLKRGNDVVARLVIEVKLHSGKSGGGEAAEDEGAVVGEARHTDQLWKYFRHSKETFGPQAIGLVYLTADAAPPQDELGESLRCGAAEMGGEWLGWLSWRDVWAAMGLVGGKHLPARDLAAILDAKGLKDFDGFAMVPVWTPPSCMFEFRAGTVPAVKWFEDIPIWAGNVDPEFWRF